MYIDKTNLVVRYAETDKMGIVHHSNYYIWFEMARSEFIKKIGISYSKFEENNIMMPLVETHCKYYEGAKYDDNIRIETNIDQLTPVKVIFTYNVFREKNNKLLAKGKTVQTFINEDFKIINLKKTHNDLWNKLQVLI
ncbi:acyl-CoA thioesterase [Clostridium fermenticellae]|uniref:Acyl-CoA thioesterase n=1 Tax=Clostridium fermenticellae TaxID=2068654 RepID=A0A386H472_9CLOT|nr:thioesterase family protein [Clostridium fermenticellae]AYD40285.1 acyl-CoA thioesterase [Clostridium fermenticellae]